VGAPVRARVLAVRIHQPQAQRHPVRVPRGRVVVHEHPGEDNIPLRMVGVLAGVQAPGVVEGVLHVEVEDPGALEFQPAVGVAVARARGTRTAAADGQLVSVRHHGPGPAGGVGARGVRRQHREAVDSAVGLRLGGHRRPRREHGRDDVRDEVAVDGEIGRDAPAVAADGLDGVVAGWQLGRQGLLPVRLPGRNGCQ